MNTESQTDQDRITQLEARLQAAERDNGLLKEQIRVADVAYQSLHERHQVVEAERDLLIQMLDHVGYPEVSRRQLRELLQPAQKEQ